MADDAAATTVAVAKAVEDRRLVAKTEAHAEEACLRAVALDEYEAAHEAIWAQATTIVNVKALIPVVLDQAMNTYTKWRGMFLTILGKYVLTRHVLKDEAFPAHPVGAGGLRRVDVDL
jgi:hypothetical protein